VRTCGRNETLLELALQLHARPFRQKPHDRRRRSPRPALRDSQPAACPRFRPRQHPDFETLGIPIVQGRGFTAADAASPGMVAVVNETLVKTFWKDVNPIGQRLAPAATITCPGSRSWALPRT
jgi:hypothetical protein